MKRGKNRSSNNRINYSLPYKLLIFFAIILIVIILSSIALIIINKFSYEKSSLISSNDGTTISKPSKENELKNIGLFSFDNYRVRSGEIAKGNCTDQSLKEIWDYTFNEPSNDIRIYSNKDIDDVCNFSIMYKVMPNNMTYLIWTAFDRTNSNSRIIGQSLALYGNLTSNGTKLINEVNESSLGWIAFLILYGENQTIYDRRNLSSQSLAELEYNRIFKASNGSFEDYSDYFTFYISNSTHGKSGAIFKDLQLDGLYLTEIDPKPINLSQIKNIPNIVLRGPRWYNSVINLDNYFVNLGLDSNLSFNYMLADPSSAEVYYEGYYWGYSHGISMKGNISKSGTYNMNITLSYPEQQSVTSNNFNITIYSCFDSDNGITINKSGYSYNSTDYGYSYDSCFNSTTLSESYCDNNNIKTSIITCESKDYCINNACKKKINITQINNISGIEIHSDNKTNILMHLNSYFDNLGDDDYDVNISYSININDSFKLYFVQYYQRHILGIFDYNSYIGSAEVNLTLSYPDLENVTTNNFVINYSICNDPDSLLYYSNIYLRSSTTNLSFTGTDFCVDSDTLTEYFCSYDNVDSWNYNCDNGYKCLDGACVLKEINLTQTKNIENIFLTGENSSIYSISLRNYFDSLGIYDYNLTMVAIINDSNAFKVKMSYGRYHDLYFYDFGYFTGTYSMNLTFSYLDKENVTSNNFNVNYNICNDLDYFDIYTKTITRNSTYSATDYCINSTDVVEYRCYRADIKSYNYSCDYGYSCSDGACKSNNSGIDIAPDFKGNICDDFQLIKNHAFAFDVTKCFSDYNGDILSYRYSIGSGNFTLSRTGNNITINPDNNWIGNGYLYIYANDSEIETRGKVDFNVKENSTTNTNPNINNNNNVILTNNRTNSTNTNSNYSQNNNSNILILSSSSPSGENVAIFKDENKSFSVQLNKQYDDIEWYIDDVLKDYKGLEYNVKDLSVGNHTIKVIAKSSGESVTKVWSITVEKSRETSQDVKFENVLFYSVMAVIIIIIGLITWLLIYETNLKNKKQDPGFGTISSQSKNPLFYKAD